MLGIDHEIVQDLMDLSGIDVDQGKFGIDDDVTRTLDP